MIGRHRHVTRWLSDWIEGTLPPARRKAVERHLARCDRCRWQAESLRATLRWLDALEDVPPPADLAAAVRQRLEAAGPGLPPKKAPRGPGRLARRLAVPAAAAGLILVQVWAMGQGLGWAPGRLAPSAVVWVAGAAPAAAGDADRHPGAEAAATPSEGYAGPETDLSAQGLQPHEPRTGRLELVVADVMGADAALEAVVRQWGGILKERRRLGTGRGAPVQVTFRVPDGKLEAVLDALARWAPPGSVAAGPAVDAGGATHSPAAGERAEPARLQEPPPAESDPGSSAGLGAPGQGPTQPRPQVVPGGESPAPTALLEVLLRPAPSAP